MNIFEKMQAAKAEREAREKGIPPDTKGTTLIERMNAAKAAVNGKLPSLRQPEATQATLLQQPQPTQAPAQVKPPVVLAAKPAAIPHVSPPEAEPVSEPVAFEDFDVDAEAVAEDLDEFDEAFFADDDDDEGAFTSADVAEIAIEEEAPAPRKSLAIPKRADPVEKLAALDNLTALGIVTEDDALPLPEASDAGSTSTDEATSQPAAQTPSVISRVGLTLPTSQVQKPQSEPPSDSIPDASLPKRHGLSLPGNARSVLPSPQIDSPAKPSVSSLLKPPALLKSSPPAIRASVLPTVKSSTPLTTEPAPSTEPAATATPAASIAVGSPLGKLLERRNASTERPVNVSAGALSCISASGGVAVYSPAQFHEDWNNTQDDDEGANETRAELVRKVAARLQQIYSTEMEKLTASVASVKTMEEITMLVKLTFLRVRDCEHAWNVLDRMDRGAIIQGMALMAQKRNSAVRSRKPREATAMSNAMEDMVSGGISIEDVLGEDAMGDFSFGIEGL